MWYPQGNQAYDRRYAVADGGVPLPAFTAVLH
jgi:hypothetical protein